MSARQNKKNRKGRNNPNNRERTVTTLTEDPNTPYLVPTPSEEPAIMSSPFSVASSSGNNPASSAYQPPSNYATFGYSNSFGNTMQHQQQQFFPQPQQQSQNILPLGRNDLEILENLKELIKSNQHEVFRAIPQPAALANVYLGPISTSKSSQADQGPSQANPAGSGPSSPVDLGRRPPRLQSKEGWDPAGQRKNLVGSSANTTNNNSHAYGGRFNTNSNPPAAINTSNLSKSSTGASTNSAGPSSAGLQSIDVHMSDNISNLKVSTSEGLGPNTSRFDPNSARTPGSAQDQGRAPDRHGESGYGGPRGPGPSLDKISYDGKDDRNWPARDGLPPSVDNRRRDSDARPPSSPNSRSAVTGSSDMRLNPGDRVPPLSRDDSRYFDSRDRDRDRDRDYRDRRDWDSRRSQYNDRSRSGMTDARRPPDNRHYESDYDRVPPRRYDAVNVKEEPVSDARRLSDIPTIGDGRSVGDRLPPPTAAAVPSARVPPSPTVANVSANAPVRAPLSDNRPSRGPSFETVIKPSPAVDDRVPASDRDVSMTPVIGERSSVPVAVARSQIPLEERISGRPSLQERIGQAQPPPSSGPPASRSVEPTRSGASLEERLSAIPVSADSREQRGRIPDRDRVPPLDDRSARPLPQDDRRVDDRPGRYNRPSSPPPPVDRASYPPIRDDPRGPPKGLPSPPPRGIPPRDYPGPPGRPGSRERPIGGSYRPDDSRYIPDGRRSDAMDVDPPSRYGEGPVTRSVPYNRPFSPPSAADLARDRARVQQQFPPSPPPRSSIPLDAPPYEDDRRYPPQPPRDSWPGPGSYGSYGVGGAPGDRRREWSAADEDYYNKTRQWDRGGAGGPPPPSSASAAAERYERELLPPQGARWGDERERREYQRPPSPSRSAYDGASRTLSSRISDNYSSSGPPGDRSFAPPPSARDPYNRMRQRSASPIRRAGPGAGPGPGGPPIDDLRPMNKRPREEGYPSDYYTSPQTSAQNSRDPGPPLRRQENYPPHSRGGTPPPSGGGGYFGGPPPSSASTGGGAADSRDYGPRDYAAPPYERSRSPGPARGYSRGGGYGARGDGRDDRRYFPPAPQSMPPPGRRP